MKLHLPKMLRVAVIAAAMSSATSFAAELTKENISYPQDDTTTSDVKEGISYLNVGMEYETDTWQGNLVVGDLADVQGDVDNVGAFNDSWVFVTPDGGKTNTKYTSSLKVSGDITIQGNGKVVLGGQCNGGDNYAGLEATGTIKLDGGTLQSTKIIADALVVNGGNISTHTGNCTSGANNTWAVGTAKQTYFKSSVTINDGTVQLGYTGNAQGIGTTNHRMSAFGSNSNFQLVHNGGTLQVTGNTEIYAGATVTQQNNAGKMVFRDAVYLRSSGSTTFNQGGTSSAKLLIGQFINTSYKGSITFNQTGSGYIHLAYGSNLGQGSKINLNQEGAGIIDLGGAFDSRLVDTNYGNFTSSAMYTNGFVSKNTVYNIKQTGTGTINVKSDADFSADEVYLGEQSTLNVSGLMVITASSQIDGKLVVAEGGLYQSKELNLNKKSNISSSGAFVAGVETPTITAADTIYVTTNGALNLDDGYGSATHTGAIKDVQMTGGALSCTGTVSLESIQMSGGEVLISDKGDKIKVDDFSAGQGSTVNYLVTDSTATGTPLTITSAFSVASGAIFELSFTDSYLSTESNGGDTIAFTINVADLTGVESTQITFDTGSVITDCVTWELDDVEWSVTNNIGTLSGTLTRITDEIVIEEETEINNALDGSLKLVIKEDTAISTDNTHTGGTEINNADVVLNSESALGDGSVTTTGESSIIGAYKADDGSLTVLPEVIKNGEDLTIEGSFDGTELVMEIQKDSFISAEGALGKNGFVVKDGQLIQVVENTTDSSSLTIGAVGASITKDGTVYTIYECGYAANLDYDAYNISDADHEVSMKEILAAGGSSNTVITMTDGTLLVDQNANNLQASGGTVLQANYTIKGKLSGGTVLKVTKGTANWLYGDNDYSGGTEITGATLKLGDVNALGLGGVSASGNSALDSSNVVARLNNAIENSGTLTMKGKYDGSKLATQVLELGDAYISSAGELGANGFFRDGTALVVVKNTSDTAELKTNGTVYVYKNNNAYTLGKDGLAVFTDMSTYHINKADHEVAMSDIVDAAGDESVAVKMSAGVLVADTNVNSVEATGGKIQTLNDVTVQSTLSGTTSVSVGQGTATLTGDNSHTGDTVVDGKKSILVVGSEKALGQSTVHVYNGGKLDLNNQAVSNHIELHHSNQAIYLRNAGSYTGDLLVDGSVNFSQDVTANKVSVTRRGYFYGSSLTTNVLEMQSGAKDTIGMVKYGEIAVAINPGGSIILNNGNVVKVNGSLTLGAETTFILNGDGYTQGTVLVSTTQGVNPVVLMSADRNNSPYATSGNVILTNGYGTYVVVENNIVLNAFFNQNKGDEAVLSNWGIATASRAVVNAVRGQRSNTGCIANGKGTAWVASLGSKHEINGSDIDISGAAVGADMQVGRNSRIGIALGYAEGEVQPSGLRQVDQEGSYLAVYGEHGLKKLSSTSCLSMDWVAAYGTTDSEGAGLKWEQDSLQLNSRVNWNKKVNNRLCMSVFGGLEYFANNSDTVDGVKTGSIQNLRGEIGVGARYVAWGTPAVTDGKSGLVLAQGCEKLVLNGEIRYMNDMVRSNPVIRMNGLSGMGDNPGRQGIGIEAGATYRIGERWSASANYGFNTMEDSKEHRVNVGAAYTF